MSERRNAELSRSALLVAAGGSLVAVTQRVGDGLDGALWAQALLILGGGVIVAGLAGAVRSLMRRGDADQ